MVAVSAGTVVPGVVLTRPEWLSERISDMGISWGTGDARVSGTLWWCMAASSLIDPVVTACAAGRPAPDTVLEHLLCEIRPDGGVERVFSATTSDGAESHGTSDHPVFRDDGPGDDAGGLTTTSSAGPVPRLSSGPVEGASGGYSGEPSSDACGGRTVGSPGGRAIDDGPDRAVAHPGDIDGRDADDSENCCAGTSSVREENPGRNLRETLARIIPLVAEVSGASVASLWAIVADAIGNRALDAGDAEAGARLAAQVAGRLPVPRFTDIGGRTFVRRISCCLVFEAPGCQMCTSCPKRPAAERHELLAALAARG